MIIILIFNKKYTLSFVPDKTFLKVGFPFGISHFIVNIVLHNDIHYEQKYTL
jgi:hypothetical protein